MINDKMAKIDDTLRKLMESPHILVAGTTGAGKSVLINAMLYSRLKSDSMFYRSQEQMAEVNLIDTKRVGLAMWKDWPGVFIRQTEPSKVVNDLDFLIECMEGVYWRMEQRGLEETDEHDVYIVIDELADVISEKGVLDRLVKIGRLGRAAHYHLLCGTQDPSRNTLSAQLMQNFTCRIALRTKDEIESRQIVGIKDAMFITGYGRAIASCNGRTGWITFDMVPRADIDNLVVSTRNAYEWNKWMNAKPTFIERITGARKKLSNYFFEECMDPTYADNIILRKATF